ncbi:MAG: DUF285 domain-containing protein, partial [Bacteroidales bacterium]|nr:DUF285 domain-containing protein [Bacteroidales bacterium]
MRNMLRNAYAFDCDISGWDVSNVGEENFSRFLRKSNLSTIHYDRMLALWEPKLQPNTSLHGGNSQYCLAEEARERIIANDQTMTDVLGGDDSKNCDAAFISTWRTTTANEEITIPVPAGVTGYDFNIYWGDRASNDLNSFEVLNDADISTTGTRGFKHTFAQPGEYTIKIMGNFPRIYFNNTGDRNKIISVDNWGSIQWASFENAFYGCENLTVTSGSEPNLSNVSNMDNMFNGASKFNTRIGEWDISKLTTAQNMISHTAMSISNYDDLLIRWYNQAQVHNINAVEFSAEGIQYCRGRDAREALIFRAWGDGDVTNNTEDPVTKEYTDIADAGRDCSPKFTFVINITQPNETFTLPIDPSLYYNFDISWGDNNLTTPAEYSGTGLTVEHQYTYAGTYQVQISGDAFPRIIFNQYGQADKLLFIYQWGSINWQSMEDAFAGCTNMTYPSQIDDPYLGNVSSTKNMFADCTRFNANLNGWHLSNITNMSGMFQGATAFTNNNEPLTWDSDLNSVKDMSHMFDGATNFNTDITNWDVGTVENMSYMFNMATAFNQDITGWNTSSVTNMDYMFSEAENFDQYLGRWPVNSLTTAAHMLSNSGLSLFNYGMLLIDWNRKRQTGDAKNDVPFAAETLNYCLGVDDRQSLIDNGWGIGGTIPDGGPLCDHVFELVWDNISANETITIPTNGLAGYDFIINWGDGHVDYFVDGHTFEHTYTQAAPAGGYTIKISGNFPQIYFNSNADAPNITQIKRWGTIKWQTMANAFAGCTNLNITAGDAPDLSEVLDMSGMFNNAASLNANLNNWDVSNVAEMRDLFHGAAAFNNGGADLDWEVDRVEHMERMFMKAENFNANISNWNVSEVRNMYAMFFDAFAFNQNLNNWDVDKVSNMGYMFAKDSWHTSDMSYNNNNQPLTWGAKTAQVHNMEYMFANNSAFNADISSFYINSLSNAQSMLDNSGITKSNYDKLLRNFNNQVNASIANTSARDIVNVAFSAVGINYCSGASARTNLINNGWGDGDSTAPNDNTDIVDAGEECSDAFIITWRVPTDDLKVEMKLTNKVIQADGDIIYTHSAGLTYTIDWGDGSIVNYDNTMSKTHTYDATYAGKIVTIKLSGDFTRFELASEQQDDLLTIEQWGAIQWSTMEEAFLGASKLQLNASGAPDLTNATSLNRMFQDCEDINADISHWNVSNIKDVSFMFYNATAFNNGGQPLDWGNNTANFEDMTRMFMRAENFNQNVSGWNVNNVTTLEGMFQNAKKFNNGDKPLNWTFNSVSDIDKVFMNATAFNQPVTWNLDGAESLVSMFEGATAFNQDVSNWNVSSIRNLQAMFKNATGFNNGGQPLNWNTASVEQISQMFYNAQSFNQDISGWNISSLGDVA